MTEIGKFKKLCYYCKHFEFHNGHENWSDVTPGEQLELWCDLSKWQFDSCSTSQQKFAEILETAEKCENFELNKSILHFKEEVKI